MKIKPLYIYGAVIVLVIAFLLIFSTDSSKNADKKGGPLTGQEMPQDDIHKGLGNPSGANVPEEIKVKMEELKKAYEANPSDTLKARQYADFVAAGHRADEAIPVYEKILAKNSKRSDIRITLAQIYFDKGDYNKSEELINSILSYDRNNQLAQYNLGVLAAAKGDKAKARSIFQKIMKDYPKSAIAIDAEKAIVSIEK